MALQAFPASAQFASGGAGCTGFEQLSPSSQLTPGKLFASGGIRGKAVGLIQPGGSRASGGSVDVNPGSFSGGGREVVTKDAALRFRFPDGVSGVSFAYEDRGGRVSLRVNGDLYTQSDFAALNGATIGGNTVVVRSRSGGSAQTGFITVQGNVEELIVGGEGLAIDDVCFGCITFEDVPTGISIQQGRLIVTGGYVVEVKRFVTEDGGTLAGQGLGIGDSPVNKLRGGHKGFMGNVQAAPQLVSPADTITFRYQNRGGQIDLRVNGNMKVTSDGLPALDGQTVGGAEVRVQSSPSNAYTGGIVTVVGKINDFAVGGQELFVDDVCICSLEESGP